MASMLKSRSISISISISMSMSSSSASTIVRTEGVDGFDTARAVVDEECLCGDNSNADDEEYDEEEEEDEEEDGGDGEGDVRGLAAGDASVEYEIIEPEGVIVRVVATPVPAAAAAAARPEAAAPTLGVAAGVIVDATIVAATVGVDGDVILLVAAYGALRVDGAGARVTTGLARLDIDNDDISTYNDEIGAACAAGSSYGMDADDEDWGIGMDADDEGCGIGVVGGRGEVRLMLADLRDGGF